MPLAQFHIVVLPTFRDQHAELVGCAAARVLLDLTHNSCCNAAAHIKRGQLCFPDVSCSSIPNALLSPAGAVPAAASATQTPALLPHAAPFGCAATAAAAAESALFVAGRSHMMYGCCRLHACNKGWQYTEVPGGSSQLRKRTPPTACYPFPRLPADWLLSHPNVDILQQHLLGPLLQAARSTDEEQTVDATAATDIGAGKGRTLPVQPLRVQIATLAPCASAYTLDFLRQMAFNLTEGYTYAGARPVLRGMAVSCHEVGGAGDGGGQHVSMRVPDRQCRCHLTLLLLSLLPATAWVQSG